MNESVLRPLILALHKTTSLLAFRRFVHFPSSFVSVVAILLLSELTTNSISLISWAVYSRFRLAFRIRNLIYVGEYVNPMIFYDNLLAQGKTSLIHLLYACGYLQCYRLIQWRIQTLWRIEGARRATQSLRKHIYHNAWFNIVCCYFVEKASTEQSSKSFFSMFLLVHVHAVPTADSLLQLISIYCLLLLPFEVRLLKRRKTHSVLCIYAPARSLASLCDCCSQDHIEGRTDWVNLNSHKTKPVTINLFRGGVPLFSFLSPPFSPFLLFPPLWNDPSNLAIWFGDRC